jgi:hypothetical protein
MLIVTLLIAPTSYAQEDTGVFTTTDGKFTFEHPVGWDFSEYAPEQIVEVPGYDTLYAFFVLGMDGAVAAEAAVIDPSVVNPPGPGARISDNLDEVIDFISYSSRRDAQNNDQVKPDWSEVNVQPLDDRNVAWVHSIHEDCPQCQPAYYFAFELGEGLYFIANFFGISPNTVETVQTEFFGILETMQVTTNTALDVAFPAPTPGEEPDSWTIDYEDVWSIGSDNDDNIYLIVDLEDASTSMVVLDSDGNFLQAFTHPTMPRITDIVFGPDGTLWLSWESGFVNLDPLDGTQLSEINVRQNTEQAHVDEEGTIYVASGSQIKIFSTEGEELAVFYADEYRADFGQSVSMVVLPDSTILIGSPGNGLVYAFDSKGNSVDNPLLSQLQADFPGNPEGYFVGIQVIQYVRGSVYVIPYQGDDIEEGIYRYDLDGERTGFLPLSISTLDRYQVFTVLSDGSVVYLSNDGVVRTPFPE